MTAYFMGVWPSRHGEVGHYCRTPNGQHLLRGAPATPWHSTYAPLGEVEAIEAGWGKGGLPARISTEPRQPEGIGRVVTRDGWTLLVCWDRSGDARGNSMAAFAFSGTLEPEDAPRRAREQFPAVWARIDAHLDRLGIKFRVEVAP